MVHSREENTKHQKLNSDKHTACVLPTPNAVFPTFMGESREPKGHLICWTWVAPGVGFSLQVLEHRPSLQGLKEKRKNDRHQRTTWALLSPPCHLAQSSVLRLIKFCPKMVLHQTRTHKRRCRGRREGIWGWMVQVMETMGSFKKEKPLKTKRVYTMTFNQVSFFKTQTDVPATQ